MLGARKHEKNKEKNTTLHDFNLRYEITQVRI